MFELSQTADTLTNALPTINFQDLRSKLGDIYTTQQPDKCGKIGFTAIVTIVTVPMSYYISLRGCGKIGFTVVVLFPSKDWVVLT